MTNLLSIEGLKASHGPREVVAGVDLDVKRGEIRALMGASGGGKSTVLRTIAGLHAFDAGTIIIDGIRFNPGRLPPQRRQRELRKAVAMVFQSHALFDHLTVLENVMLAPVHVHGTGRDDAERRARELLSELGVGERASALPRELSGGEAQRVAIARALAPGAPVLLLDEPTAALDPARRASLGTSLRRLAAEEGGRALLVATHDVDFALQFADTVTVMAEGRVVEEGAAAVTLKTPRHAITRALLAQSV
ncbi:MAG: amino acid ABC transporter ATP-binding protein [Gemmatimonadota bacterium]